MSKPADATVQVTNLKFTLIIESTWFDPLDAKLIAWSFAEDYNQSYTARPLNREDDILWIFSSALRRSILSQGTLWVLDVSVVSLQNEIRRGSKLSYYSTARNC